MSPLWAFYPVAASAALEVFLFGAHFYLLDSAFLLEWSGVFQISTGQKLVVVF